jgi:hypothetical protein
MPLLSASWLGERTSARRSCLALQRPVHVLGSYDWRMWIPRTAEELERAAGEELLKEKTRFEVKRELPASGKNADLAVDVSALTVDGGLLIYGIDEDEHERPTVLAPIELVGARQRIDQVVQTLVDEPPHIEVDELPLADDPARGYLVVVVPQSPRAPHQVAVRGDRRFYGRSDTGNRMLSEGEVARLYRRRDEWDVDAQQLLAQCVANSPVGRGHPDFAFMHGFTQPVVLDQGLWDLALRSDGADEQQLLTRIREVGRKVMPIQGYDPALQTTLNWRRRGADVWTLDSTLNRGKELDLAYHVQADINIDGRGYLFCSRAGERWKRTDNADAPLLIFESLIAGNLGAFLAMMGAYYQAAGYVGLVDLGIALTNLTGGVSSHVQGRHILHEPPPYQAESFTRTDRVPASKLLEPEAVVQRLLRRFFDALTGSWYDPFSNER